MNDYHMYDGLTKIAFGYLFIYFNFNINTVNILPTFVGYLLILLAIRDLACEEKELLLLRPFAIILICWHGAKWLLSWGSVDLDGLLEIGGLLIGLINLYFHFQLLTNLAAIASKYQDEGDEMDATLLRCRTFQTVTLTAAMIIRKLTNLFGEYAGLITIGLAILYIIAGIIIIKTLIDLKLYLTEDEETTDRVQ
jgi:hypothetical protein